MKLSKLLAIWRSASRRAKFLFGVLCAAGALSLGTMGIHLKQLDDARQASSFAPHHATSGNHIATRADQFAISAADATKHQSANQIAQDLRRNPQAALQVWATDSAGQIAILASSYQAETGTMSLSLLASSNAALDAYVDKLRVAHVDGVTVELREAKPATRAPGYEIAAELVIRLKAVTNSNR